MNARIEYNNGDVLHIEDGSLTVSQVEQQARMFKPTGAVAFRIWVRNARTLWKVA